MIISTIADEIYIYKPCGSNYNFRNIAILLIDLVMAHTTEPSENVEPLDFSKELQESYIDCLSNNSTYITKV